ncbi:ATP/GTP-binding protein [Streptomyces sp. NBC_00257]|nr:MULTISPECIES: hypothetical protein [unclassified Streptomyces]MCX5426664.1 ATP/GTP-binding protein [Streptomyces sp. NBC_00062]WTB59084.1 ATP/GTP-binding protein [Streptomyces sp. NBC_00826]WTH88041.1 ATP/GTP-binding protein [Streptomyces sp. NBC_00825]WTH96768.1 ATP/GTP-binding protein [Streptomyces sp. NBC_00822]
MAGEAVESDALALKVLVAGGFDVGKTTLVGAVSEPATAYGGISSALADTRRLEDCFPAVDCFEHRRIPCFEHRRIPFVVAVDCFAGARTHGEREVSRALDPDLGTPVVLCDARDRDSGKEVLIRMVEYAGRMHTARLLDSASRPCRMLLHRPIWGPDQAT